MREKESLVVVIIAVVLVLLFIATMFFVTLIFYRNRKRKLETEARILNQAFDEEVLRAKLEMQEETFRHISQEIHDNVGQLLSIVSLNMNTITMENLKENIGESSGLLSRAIKDLRDISKSLNANYVSEIGLVAAIKQQVSMISKAGKLDIKINEQGDRVVLRDQKVLVIFRIFQELTNNIIKHAHAARVVIDIDNRNDHLHMTITDDGVGFVINGADGSEIPGGIGLANIAHRAKLIGATLDVRSEEKKGTSVTLRVPHDILTQSNEQT
jgi:signal transduction histidine kinase